jgi:hypothetical protein
MSSYYYASQPQKVPAQMLKQMLREIPIHKMRIPKKFQNIQKLLKENANTEETLHSKILILMAQRIK